MGERETEGGEENERKLERIGERKTEWERRKACERERERE